MIDGTALAGLWALCAGGGLLLVLSALTVLASAGLLRPPSLDLAPRPTKLTTTTRSGSRGPGTPPAPAATTDKEGPR